MSALLVWADQGGQIVAQARADLGLAPLPSQFLALEFDATLSEDHSQTAQVTEHPVETGAPISDHVKPDLARLSIQGLVTNTPLTDVLLSSRADPTTTANVAPIQLLDFPRVIQIDTKRQLQPGRVILPQVSPFKFPGIKRAASPAQAFPGVWVTDSSFLASRLKGSAQDASKQDRVKMVYDALTELAFYGTPIQVFTSLRNYPRMVITSVSAPVKPEDAITFSIDFKEFRTADVSVVSITKSRKPSEDQKRAQDLSPKGPKGPGYTFTETPELRSDLKRIGSAAGL